MSSAPDDFLWDPAAPLDPELRALEQALRPLRAALPPFDPGRRLQPVSGRRWPWLAAVAAAAGIALAVWVAGGDGGALRPGAAPQRFVAGASGMTLPFGAVAELDLAAGAELWFDRWAADRLQLRLVAGRIDVRVAPPPAVAPGFFRVGTPAGEVVDLGCRYRLELQANGREHVRVTEGLVEFAGGGRRAVVPAGAECRVEAGRPSTPLFVDAPGRLRDLCGKFDAATAFGAMDREKLAAMVGLECDSGRDTLPLWHLLLDVDPAVRALAEQRLLELEGPPPGALPSPAKTGAPHAEADTWLPFLRLGAWSRPR